MSFPDDKDVVIGRVEAAVGVGLITGPPIASFIYGYFGFSSVFCVFAFWLFLAMAQHMWIVPNSVNHVGDEKHESEKADKEAEANDQVKEEEAELLKGYQ